MSRARIPRAAKPLFSALDLAVWRLVRDAEGYSRTGDVLALLPGFHTAHQIGGALKRLSTAGHLAQVKGWKGCRYAYTTRCIAPEGESPEPQLAGLGSGA